MKESSTDTAASKAPRSLASARTYTRTEVAAAGTPLNMQPSDGGTYAVAAGSFTIKPGGALVTARVTIDDSGTMEIRDAGGSLVMSVGGGLGDWTKTKDPTT